MELVLLLVFVVWLGLGKFFSGDCHPIQMNPDRDDD